MFLTMWHGYFVWSVKQYYIENVQYDVYLVWKKYIVVQYYSKIKVTDSNNQKKKKVHNLTHQPLPTPHI